MAINLIFSNCAKTVTRQLDLNKTQSYNQQVYFKVQRAKNTRSKHTTHKLSLIQQPINKLMFDEDSVRSVEGDEAGNFINENVTYASGATNATHLDQPRLFCCKSKKKPSCTFLLTKEWQKINFDRKFSLFSTLFCGISIMANYSFCQHILTRVLKLQADHEQFVKESQEVLGAAQMEDLYDQSNLYRLRVQTLMQPIYYQNFCLLLLVLQMIALLSKFSNFAIKCTVFVNLFSILSLIPVQVFSHPLFFIKRINLIAFVIGSQSLFHPIIKHWWQVVIFILITVGYISTILWLERQNRKLLSGDYVGLLDGVFERTESDEDQWRIFMGGMWLPSEIIKYQTDMKPYFFILLFQFIASLISNFLITGNLAVQRQAAYKTIEQLKEQINQQIAIFDQIKGPFVVLKRDVQQKSEKSSNLTIKSENSKFLIKNEGFFDYFCIKKTDGVQFKEGIPVPKISLEIEQKSAIKVHNQDLVDYIMSEPLVFVPLQQEYDKMHSTQNNLQEDSQCLDRRIRDQFEEINLFMAILLTKVSENKCLVFTLNNPNTDLIQKHRNSMKQYRMGSEVGSDTRMRVDQNRVNSQQQGKIFEGDNVDKNENHQKPIKIRITVSSVLVGNQELAIAKFEFEHDKVFNRNSGQIQFRTKGNNSGEILSKEIQGSSFLARSRTTLDKNTKSDQFQQDSPSQMVSHVSLSQVQEIIRDMMAQLNSILTFSDQLQLRCKRIHGGSMTQNFMNPISNSTNQAASKKGSALFTSIKSQNQMENQKNQSTLRLARRKQSRLTYRQQSGSLILSSDMNSYDDFRLAYHINSSAKILFHLILNANLSIDVAKKRVRFKSKSATSQLVNQIVVQMIETQKLFILEKQMTFYIEKLQTQEKKVSCDWNLYQAALFTMIRISLNNSANDNQLFLHIQTIGFDDWGKLSSIQSDFTSEMSKNQSEPGQKVKSNSSNQKDSKYLITVLFYQTSFKGSQSNNQSEKVELDNNFKATRQICESIGGHFFYIQVHRFNGLVCLLPLNLTNETRRRLQVNMTKPHSHFKKYIQVQVKQKFCQFNRIGDLQLYSKVSLIDEYGMSSDNDASCVDSRHEKRISSDISYKYKKDEPKVKKSHLTLQVHDSITEKDESMSSSSQQITTNGSHKEAFLAQFSNSRSRDQQKTIGQELLLSQSKGQPQYSIFRDQNQVRQNQKSIMEHFKEQLNSPKSLTQVEQQLSEKRLGESPESQKSKRQSLFQEISSNNNKLSQASIQEGSSHVIDQQSSGNQEEESSQQSQKKKKKSAGKYFEDFDITSQISEGEIQVHIELEHKGQPYIKNNFIKSSKQESIDQSNLSPDSPIQLRSNFSSDKDDQSVTVKNFITKSLEKSIINGRNSNSRSGNRVEESKKNQENTTSFFVVPSKNQKIDLQSMNVQQSEIKMQSGGISQDSAIFQIINNGGSKDKNLRKALNSLSDNLDRQLKSSKSNLFLSGKLQNKRYNSIETVRLRDSLNFKAQSLSTLNTKQKLKWQIDKQRNDAKAKRKQFQNNKKPGTFEKEYKNSLISSQQVISEVSESKEQSKHRLDSHLSKKLVQYRREDEEQKSPMKSEQRKDLDLQKNRKKKGKNHSHNFQLQKSFSANIMQIADSEDNYPKNLIVNSVEQENMNKLDSYLDIPKQVAQNLENGQPPLHFEQIEDSSVSSASRDPSQKSIPIDSLQKSQKKLPYNVNEQTQQQSGFSDQQNDKGSKRSKSKDNGRLIDDNSQQQDPLDTLIMQKYSLIRKQKQNQKEKSPEKDFFDLKVTDKKGQMESRSSYSKNLGSGLSVVSEECNSKKSNSSLSSQQSNKNRKVRSPKIDTFDNSKIQQAVRQRSKRLLAPNFSVSRCESSSADKSSLVSNYMTNSYKNCYKSSPQVINRLYDEKGQKWWLKPRGDRCSCNSTILMVDANIYNIAPLKMILSKAFNLSASRAQSGEEAISKMTQNWSKTCCKLRYNIIFMDINMTGMNGIETSKQIMILFNELADKGQIALPPAPKIFAMISFGDYSHFIRDKDEFRFAATIEKPITWASIQTQIERNVNPLYLQHMKEEKRKRQEKKRMKILERSN